MDAACRVHRLSPGKSQGLWVPERWHSGRLCYIMGCDLCLENLPDRRYSCTVFEPFPYRTRSILSSAPQCHACMVRGRSSSDEAKQNSFRRVGMHMLSRRNDLVLNGKQ